MSEYDLLSVRLDRFDRWLRGVSKAIGGMSKSLTVCQTRCHVDRETHARHVKWSVAALTSVLAAVAASAITHWFSLWR
jgi:hypothetical protein